LPAPTKGQVECTNLSDPQSGANYFRTYINALPSNKRPDFIVNHGYTFCKEDGPGSLSSVDEFKESIRTQRQLMKELGYGKDYEKYPDLGKGESYLPEKIKGKKYLRKKE